MRQLFVVLAVLSAATIVPTNVGADHGLGITSITPTSGGYGVTVDVYGYGFSHVQSVVLRDAWWNAWDMGYTYHDDGHLSFEFTLDWASAGDYTIVVTSCDYYCTEAQYSYFTYSPEDADQDGSPSHRDCADGDSMIYPGARDWPYDGIDQDCSGADARLPDFRGSLRVSLGSNFDDATFGIAEDATAGFDPGYDTPQPPTPIGSTFTEAYFVNLAGGPQNLSTSVQKDALSVTWDLQMRWQQECNCTHYGVVYWNQWEFNWLPPEFQVYLVDGATVYDLRSKCCYHHFYVNGGSGTKDLRIVVSTDVVEYVYLSYPWSLVSLPVTPHNASVGSVFGDAVDAVYTWDGVSYVPVDTVQPGVGYWVHLTRCCSTMVSVLGTPVDGFDLTLSPGWNLVGSPRGCHSLESAPYSVSRTAFRWEWSGYLAQTYLCGGSGYWVYSHETAATFRLGSNGAATLATPALPTLDSSSESEAAAFELPLALTDATGAKDAATLRTAEGATNGFDAALDVPEAPRAAADTWARAYFLGENGFALDQSAVAPASTSVFQLVVEREGAAGETRFAWESATLPEGYVVELVDGMTRVDMREAASYAWASPAGLSTKTFHVVVRPVSDSVCLAELDGACLVALPVGILS
ncbi:MAG TPA: putative metal-binding motif-containing protein [Candidatus Thermoplasmatota archaeon]|nr:putative metal-binding motif-containing protein [Candidatus Thermoplasmatota archaeon]